MSIYRIAVNLAATVTIAMACVAICHGQTTTALPTKQAAYVGLIYDTNGVEAASSGYLRMVVGHRGAWSGTMRLDRSSYALSGRFQAVSNTAVSEVAVTARLRIALELESDGTLKGSVTEYGNRFRTNVEWVAEVNGRRCGHNATNQIPGRYNLAISTVTNGPAGDGCATVVLGGNGAVTMGVHLADFVTAPRSFSTLVAEDGSFPLYAPLYRGQGVILGWLQFTNDVANQYDLESEEITWSAPSNVVPSFPDGFSASTTAVGSRFDPAQLREILAAATNGALVIEGFGYGAPLATMSYNAKTKAFGFGNYVPGGTQEPYYNVICDCNIYSSGPIPDGIGAAKLKVNAANGFITGGWNSIEDQTGFDEAFTGGFYWPVRSFFGIYLPRSHQGFGYTTSGGELMFTAQ